MLRILCREQWASRFPPALGKRFMSDKSIEPAAEKAAKDVDEANSSDQSIHRRMYAPSNFEKRLLVWTKKFKTVEEVPRTIPVETMELARNKSRIKTCNYMILATILGCIFMAWSGKRAAQRGESVHQMNVDWHKAIKEGKT